MLPLKTDTKPCFPLCLLYLQQTAKSPVTLKELNKYIYKREQIIFLVNIYNASNMEVFNSSLNLQCIWDKTAETVISAFLLEATHRIQRKNVITRIMPLQQLN